MYGLIFLNLNKNIMNENMVYLNLWDVVKVLFKGKFLVFIFYKIFKITKRSKLN